MKKKLAFLLIISSFFCSLYGATLALPDQFKVSNRYYTTFLMDIKDGQSNKLGSIHCTQKPITTYILKNSEQMLVAQAVLKECSISKYVDAQEQIHFSRISSFFDIVDSEGYAKGGVREYWPGKYEFLNESHQVVAKSHRIDGVCKNSLEIRDLEHKLIAKIKSTFYTSRVEICDRVAFEKIAPHILLIPIGFYFHNPVDPRHLNCSCSLDVQLFEDGGLGN